MLLRNIADSAAGHDSSAFWHNVTLIIGLVGQIEGLFVSISSYLPRFYAMTAGAERLMEIESYPDETEARSADEVQRFYRDSMKALGLRNVSFTYETENTAQSVFSNISIEIKR